MHELWSRGICVVAVTLLACTATRSATPETPLIRVHGCVGEVVPLCTSVRIFESGIVEYVDPSRRTHVREMGGEDLRIVRERILAADVLSHAGDRPVGDLVGVELSAGERAFRAGQVPPDVRLLFASIDETARKLFGRRYVPLLR